jgi:uncharacterized membrane protein YfcA
VTPFAITIVLIGALGGGFISGLAGFGTAMVALGIWLHALDPGTATTLVLICSVFAQCLTFPSIWRTIRWARVWPFVAFGLMGAPVGTWLLKVIDPGNFKLAIGVLLVAFSTFQFLVRRPVGLKGGGWPADGAVGFGGGILGGLAGLSGPLPIVWASLQGWTKEDRRAVFQSFNTAVLAFSLLLHASSGLVTKNVLWLALLASPGTIIGSQIGVRAYRRLSDHHFNRAVLGLLFLSGATLVWSTLAR